MSFDMDCFFSFSSCHFLSIIGGPDETFELFFELAASTLKVLRSSQAELPGQTPWPGLSFVMKFEPGSKPYCA